MAEQAPVKAKLTVILKADEVVVAEVENATLWHSTLIAIQSGTNTVAPLGPQVPAPPGHAAHAAGDALGRLAAELNLHRDTVQGACSPMGEAPYMHLNQHNWEAMRKALPVRGPKALSPTAVGATLMALWFRHAGLGNPTQAQVSAVLGSINVTDNNPSRGIRRATWLQPRAGGQVVLNAAEISLANKVAKAFCSKSWTDWLGAEAGKGA